MSDTLWHLWVLSGLNPSGLPEDWPQGWVHPPGARSVTCGWSRPVVADRAILSLRPAQAGG